MPEIKLKPCPFCTGKAKLFKLLNKSHNGLNRGYRITCPDCKAMSALYETPEEATESWNKRNDLFGITSISPVDEQSKWICSNNKFQCEKCGFSYDHNDNGFVRYYNFCPDCGRKIISIE